MDKLPERLAGVPPVVIESLLARFTETPRGSSECVGLMYVVRQLTGCYPGFNRLHKQRRAF